jgi:superfamily II DNA or RNA helicase
MYLRAKLYIPIEYVEEEDLEKHYDHHRYEEKVCKKCEFRRMRFSDECANCEKGGYLGCIRTWGKKVIRGEQYVSLPIGDRTNIEDKLGIEFSQFKIVDLRTRSPFRTKVRFTGSLRELQVPLVDDWNEASHGLVKAPPRTGKTITSIVAAIKKKQRIAIIAHQKDFLNNFLEEIEQYTNLPELEEKHGRKLFGWMKKKEDFEEFEIGIATYQSFINDKNGRKRRRWLNENFGTVWVDEAHKGNATEFAKLISSIRMKYKGGCTATEKRKDGRHFLIEELLGPVVAATKIDTMTPTIHVHETPDVKPRNARAYSSGHPADWSRAMGFLAQHDKRNIFILDHIMKDLEAGRSIVLPTYKVDHSKALVTAINKLWGKTIAAQFVGGAKSKKLREQIIQDARAGKIRVVCGTRSLMQVGLNVPRWDTLYYALPMSNEPNWEQESSRILTPASDDVPKKSPMIRMFVDPNLGQSLGCFRSTWKHSQNLGYNFSDEARRWYSANVGYSGDGYEIDLDHYSESEIREMEATKRAKQHKAKQKQKPQSGLLGRRF